MAIFFEPAINYRRDLDRNFTVAATIETANTNIADNNYTTFSDSLEYTFITHGESVSDNTDITHIFLKGSGITSFTLSVPAGFGTGATLTQTVPSTVTDKGGTENSITIDDMQNYLYKLTTPYNCRKVTLTLVGTDVKLYEIMLLNQEFEFIPGQDFFEIGFSQVQRGGGLQTNTSGDISRYSSTNTQRTSKREIEYGVRFIGRYAYQPFFNFKNNHQEFVFSMEYELYPERVFPAIFENFTDEIVDLDETQEKAVEKTNS